MVKEKRSELMKNKKNNKKRECLILIANLVVSIVAFSFLVGLSAGSVWGDLVYECTSEDCKNAEDELVPNPSNSENSLVHDSLNIPNTEQWLNDHPTPVQAQTPPGAEAPKNPGSTTGEFKSGTVFKDTTLPPGAEVTKNSQVTATTELQIDDGGTVTTVPKGQTYTFSKDGKIISGTATAGAAGATLNKAIGGESAGDSSGLLGGTIGKLVKPQNSPSDILRGLAVGGSLYGLVKLIAPLLGADDTLTNALSTATFAGTTAFYAIRGLATPGTGLAKAAPFIGIGVGILVFVLMYKKTSYKMVKFECLPWQAPVGGENCEKCNDELHICSEYRCKSLGQACEIVNAGTDKEMCVWKNPKDVNSPMITPWKDVLTGGYLYTKTTSRPPSWGTSIIKSGGKCIPAFSPVTFGIITDKPAQCKVDYNRNTNYSDMEYSFGGTDMFLYNHTQTISIPGNSTIKSFTESTNETIEDENTLKILNGGEYNLFVRCMSANGYWNADPYVIKLCVDPNPDVSPPMVMETSIANNQPVQAGVDKVPIIVYTNEPAECKWSFDNLNYVDMQYTMSCANNLWDMQSNTYYACATELTGVKDKSSNIYYIKCKDQPWETDERNRHEMKEPYRLILQGTEPLIINNQSISPNNIIVEGSTTTVNLTLSLDTERGYDEGKSECYYSVGDESNYIAFFGDENFSNYHHEQRQDLIGGTYTYFFKCIDLGGNTATAKSKFTVFVDKSPPTIVRVLKDEGNLKIITDEDATCYYSTSSTTKCNYALDEEATQMESSTENLKEHTAPWDSKRTYYIKCKDTNNAEPYPTECSITVKAENLYVE